MYFVPKQATLSTVVNLGIYVDLLDTGLPYQLGIAGDPLGYTRTFNVPSTT